MPSRLRLVVAEEDREGDLLARGQAVLAQGAAVIEIHVPRGVSLASLARLAPSLRRFVAAAHAVRARCVSSSAHTSRALAPLGIELTSR